MNPLSVQRIEVLADRAVGQFIGAPATRDEERAMAQEILTLRAVLADVAPLASYHFGTCILCSTQHDAQTSNSPCPIGRLVAALAGASTA